MENKHYYKIDVAGRHGYSFMIETDAELDDPYYAISLALDNDLFQDYNDSNYAEVDDLVSQHDIEHFKSCGCCYHTALCE